MSMPCKSLFRLAALVALLAAPLLARADNLLDVYRLAAQSDPTLKAAEAARQAVAQAKPESRALLFPDINATASAARTRQNQTFNNPFFGSTLNETFNTHAYSLNLVQPIYRHSTFVLLRQADARIGQADAQYRATQQAVMLQVAQRYFAVLSAEDNLRFVRAEKAAIARQLEQAHKGFEAGLGTITDVQEAKARYDLAVAQEIAAQNAVANSREALGELTGRYHETLAGLGKGMPLVEPQPADVKRWTAAALRRNLRVTAARYAVKVAREQVDLRRSGYYPTLDLVGSRSKSVSGERLFGGDTTSTSIGVQLKVPLFQGGLVSARTRAAAYRYNEAQDQLEQARRAVLRQTRDAYLGVISGISRVQALQQALSSNESSLQATEAGYRAGTRTIVDVLNAERELYRARRDYADARYQYLLETLRLKQASGSLALSDLEKINAWLE